MCVYVCMYVRVCVCVCTCVCMYVFVGSCLATKVFKSKLPGTGEGWVIIEQADDERGSTTNKIVI